MQPNLNYLLSFSLLSVIDMQKCYSPFQQISSSSQCVYVFLQSSPPLFLLSVAIVWSSQNSTQHCPSCSTLEFPCSPKSSDLYPASTPLLMNRFNCTHIFIFAIGISLCDSLSDQFNDFHQSLQTCHHIFIRSLLLWYRRQYTQVHRHFFFELPHAETCVLFYQNHASLLLNV